MKRPYLGIIFIAALGVLTVAAAGYRKYQVKTSQAARELDLARIHLDYFEKVGWIRSNPDEKRYREEVRPFLRWYFDEIKEHVSRFHQNPNHDGYLVELRSRRDSDPKQAELRRAFFEYTKRAFDEMKDGHYAPVWSGTDNGMRLDIRSLAVQPVDGKPMIRMELVLWGAQRALRDDSTSASGITVAAKKRMLTSASFNVTWRLLNAQDRLVRELSASGDPSMKVDYPERFVPEFPPQMVLGYYPMDRIPADVKKVEMIFSVASHSVFGSDAMANYRWKLEPPPEWRLQPGEEWEGVQESVRSLEEIDPSAAKDASPKSGRRARQ